MFKRNNVRGTGSEHSQGLGNLGDKLDEALGVPQFTDQARRRLAVTLTDMGESGHWLVPLENLQLASSHFEFIETDRRPVLRFSGWAPVVTKAGLFFGSTGLAELACVREDAQSNRLAASRLAQIDRLYAGLSAEDRILLEALPLDTSKGVPPGMTLETAEQALFSLRNPGFVQTEDRLVWTAKPGSLWFKNALIGRRYCVWCVRDGVPRTKDIETRRPRQTCPRCHRESPYVGQATGDTFTYYGQNDSLESAHVTRIHRDNLLPRLADEHKEVILRGTEVLDFRIPRDVYAERIPADGNPINVDGVRNLILKWAQGWVPFACQSPVTGMVSTVYGSDEAPGLYIEVAGVTVRYDASWMPVVEPGGYVHAGDELAIPAERPVLKTVPDFLKLPTTTQRYLWQQVGEASWMVIEPLPEVGNMLDRTREARLSGNYRLLYPVAILKETHQGKLYVDARGCRLGQTYAVDAGVLTRGPTGAFRLNLDGLMGTGYNLFHCWQRLNEARRAQRQEHRPRIRPQAPVTAQGVVGGTLDGEFALPGSMPVREMLRHDDTHTVRPPSEGGSAISGDAGSQVGAGAGSDQQETADPADGYQGQGAVG